MTMASSRTAVGARGFAGPALRCANETVVALVLLYGTLRVQQTHAWDQKVTGASPATSLCGGGYGKQGDNGYGDQTEAGLGEK